MEFYRGSYEGDESLEAAYIALSTPLIRVPGLAHVQPTANSRPPKPGHYKHTKCEFGPCMMKASYGFSGELPRFCARHRDPMMLHLTKMQRMARRWLANYAKFGPIPQSCAPAEVPPCDFGAGNCPYGSPVPQHYVAPAVLPGEIGCSVAGCGRTAVGICPRDRQMYCDQHPEPELPAIGAPCDDPSCLLTARYGFPGDCPKLCKNHAEPGMRNLLRPSMAFSRPGTETGANKRRRVYK